jgi:hypothetical protein
MKSKPAWRGAPALQAQYLSLADLVSWHSASRQVSVRLQSENRYGGAAGSELPWDERRNWYRAMPALQARRDRKWRNGTRQASPSTYERCPRERSLFITELAATGERCQGRTVFEYGSTVRMKITSSVSAAGVLILESIIGSAAAIRHQGARLFHPAAETPVDFESRPRIVSPATGPNGLVKAARFDH